MGELYEGKFLEKIKKLKKLGDDISVDRILPRVLKIATLPLKIAHRYPLPRHTMEL